MESSQLPQHRRRNRLGEGGQLREEILRAAQRILERSGTEDAVTLRAIAREAHITAPAIYAHFPDRETVITTVIEEAYLAFVAIMDASEQGCTDDPERLRSRCSAYLKYGIQHPATYRILFERHHPSPAPLARQAADAGFRRLTELIDGCVSTGHAVSSSPSADALLVWTSVHGLTSLPPYHSRFNWPSLDQVLDTLLERLLQLRRGPTPTADTAVGGSPAPDTDACQ